MTADWDGTAFTLHGSGGKKAYMELEPGDYTFVCFNDRLEEKDGALVFEHATGEIPAPRRREHLSSPDLAALPEPSRGVASGSGLAASE